MKYEIPYDQLELAGIRRELFDALPDQEKEKLAMGHMTSILTVRIERPEGTLEMPMKLRLAPDQNGDAKLEVYALNKEVKNSLELGGEAMRRLKQGDVVMIRDNYVQLDPQTNNFLMVNKEKMDMDMRLQELEKIRDIQLGTNQKDRLKEGKPLELEVGGEKVTVGVDLRDMDHFKVLKGDMEEWKRQRDIEYDILHPEYVGFVQTDRNRWEYMVVSRKEMDNGMIEKMPRQTQSGGMKM